jgi:Glucose dehydrogenase C-terminus
VTGGNQMVEVPAAKINLEFVLGNKVMVGTVNDNREYFEAAVRDLAMARAQFPGWVAQLLTHPVQGLDNYPQLIETLRRDRMSSRRSARSLPSTRPSVRPPRTGLHMHVERGHEADLAMAFSE